jgi:hypothetical protein
VNCYCHCSYACECNTETGSDSTERETNAFHEDGFAWYSEGSYASVGSELAVRAFFHVHSIGECDKQILKDLQSDK